MVDKAHSLPQKGKAPLDQGGAGGSDLEIEITPQMVEAGVAAVRPLEYDLWEMRSPEHLGDLVSNIYRAMALNDGGTHRV